MSVGRNSPAITRAVWLTVRCSVTRVPSLRSGAHTLHAYVSIGHTCVMQTALVSPVEPPQSFQIILLMQASFSLAAFVIFLTCFSKFRLWSKVTPSIFASSLIARGIPRYVKLIGSGGKR